MREAPSRGSTPQGCATLSPPYRHHDHRARQAPDPVDARDAWEASRTLREGNTQRGREGGGVEVRGREGVGEVERGRQGERERE